MEPDSEEARLMLESIGRNLNVDPASMVVTEDDISFKLAGPTHVFEPPIERLGDRRTGRRYGRRFAVGEECICVLGEHAGVYEVEKVHEEAGSRQILGLRQGRRKIKMGNHVLLKMNERNLRDVLLDRLNSYAAVSTTKCVLPPYVNGRPMTPRQEAKFRADWRREDLSKAKVIAQALIREFRRRFLAARRAKP